MNQRTLREDHREPRDWARPWRDPPGFLLPNCVCCPTASTGAYFTGGNTGGVGNNTASGTCRLNFTTQVISGLIVGASLNTPREQLAGFGDANGHGYVAGGATNSGSSVVSSAERLTFASDTSAAITSTISSNRGSQYSTGNRSTAGYNAGGYTLFPGVNPVTTTDKFTFSSETFATTTSLSTATATGPGPMSGTKGYYCGGETSSGGRISSIRAVTFSSDAVAAIGGALSSTRRSATGTTNGTFAYISGGDTATGNTQITTTDKLTYASDTAAALTTANLPVKTSQGASTSDGTTFGYVAGGNTGGARVQTCYQFTFSTETYASMTTALPIGNINLISVATNGYT